MELQELREKVELGNFKEAIEIVEKYGETKCIEATGELIVHLMETDHPRFRNAIAIALSDMGAQEAVEPLMELLEDPKTVGNRGSLLYALESFDCSKHAQKLVQFMCEGNFEVSRQSYLVLQACKDKISMHEREWCIGRLQQAIDELEDKEQAAFLSEAIDELFGE
ncbi:HEAT repeat domain-containing protein [Tumebacillus flagellatus]|uniref:PBS lyase n=1 Tax=Tumebacillus flagellatus TaxID=1157490 RepID=A0A074LTL9_9BACL|nr:HEAT repeat domain-containing protein [Tumebacillus flagellatus]KEO83128.1 hypothetical protein EL26_11710 [Tumebacillus flagellatus]